MELALSAFLSTVPLPCQPPLGPRTVSLCDAVIEPQHALDLLRGNIPALALWQVERFAAEVRVLFGGSGLPGWHTEVRIYFVSEPSACQLQILSPILIFSPPHQVLRAWFVKNGSERRASG